MQLDQEMQQGIIGAGWRDGSKQVQCSKIKRCNKELYAEGLRDSTWKQVLSIMNFRC
jgi:hypothetical protein